MAAPAGLAASAGAPAAKSAAPGLDTAAAAVGSAAPDKAAGDQGPEPAASGAAAAAGAPARSTTQQAAQQATVLVVDAVSTVPVATGLKVAGWRGRPEAITVSCCSIGDICQHNLYLSHTGLDWQEKDPGWHPERAIKGCRTHLCLSSSSHTNMYRLCDIQQVAKHEVFASFHTVLGGCTACTAECGILLQGVCGVVAEAAAAAGAPYTDTPGVLSAQVGCDSRVSAQVGCEHASVLSAHVGYAP